MVRLQQNVDYGEFIKDKQAPIHIVTGGKFIYLVSIRMTLATNCTKIPKLLIKGIQKTITGFRGSRLYLEMY